MKLASTLAVLLTCSCSLAGTNELYADALSWTGPKYLGYAGDSLSGGLGIGIFVLGNSISNASAGKLTVGNHSAGGSRWTNMVSQARAALTNNPRWLVIHCGINDGNQCLATLEQVYPCYWPTIVSNLDYISTLCIASNAGILLSEILPYYTNYQAFSYPGILLLNAACANWCVTNPYSTNTKMLIHHDAFAITNPVSGNLDWLNSDYHSSPSDGLHLNQAGYNFWGPLIVSNLASLYPAAEIIITTIQNLSVGTLILSP